MQNLLPLNGVWALVLTCGAYMFGQHLRKKSGSAICNPTLIAAIIIIGFLLLSGIPNQTYQDGMKLSSWLLTPCTVCLGISFYTQLKRMKGKLVAISIGVGAGALSSLLMIGVFCALLKLDVSITASLLPKSITTAMAIPLVEPTSGYVPVTTAAIIITGIGGSMIGQYLCRLFRITDPIAQGVAFGTASHVMGTSRATELNELSGAVGSLSLCVAGIITAILYSPTMKFFG